MPPVETRKYIRAECQHPDHVLHNIKQEASGKLVNEYENKKRQPVIIRPDLGFEKHIDNDPKPEYDTGYTINIQCFSYSIGYPDNRRNIGVVIKLNNKIPPDQLQLPQADSKV